MHSAVQKTFNFEAIVILYAQHLLHMLNKMRKFISTKKTKTEN